MTQFFFRRILIVISLMTFALSAMEISSDEAESIGRGIFLNECSGQKERLVWWNDGENFASLGIGHFIWYPKDCKGPFEETFPSLLTFFGEQHLELPDWLKGADGCLWSTKEAFSDKTQDVKKRELQDLLARSVSLQATFIGKRFEEAMQKILSSMSEEKRKHAIKQIELLQKSAQGKFALIDYLNFKGAGTLETESYKGKGWGLKQVLEEMPVVAENPLRAFSETAKALLKQRVESSPPERQEERWLKGWLARIDRYAKFI